MGDGSPSGMISFLFTDIEGSTHLWESDPEGAADAIALHDSIIREIASGGGGHVFSTAGDSFGIAFSAPTDALGAALSIQLRLSEADRAGPPVRVRMGIHMGPAEARDNDYFGPTLNRAARIMSAGNGGQILVSSVIAEAGAGSRLDGVSFDDLGVHELSDLDHPERIFEVRHINLPAVDAPIRTVSSRRDNLTDSLTSFVGRKQLLADLAEAASTYRLTVLTGVGGTGKTRLAVEFARRRIPDFPDGVWLVELAPVTDPSLVFDAIGDVWGLRAGEGMAIDEVVLRHLFAKQTLLIIDNCEHLLEASAAAIRRLLEGSPDLRVVATSRESLGISGEHLIGVTSLTLPDSTAVESESAQLFLERARAVRPDFEPDSEETEAIARVCRRVDGIPLGVELAAARLRSLSVTELADRLEESFRILAGSAKTALPRQRTLQATIDWSYDLLQDSERGLFRRLSVFAGGFDLAMAEAVCTDDEIAEWQVIDLIDSLVDKSLVVANQGSHGSTRYRLLEPVRQYAQEKLGESGESVVIRNKHARYFADWAAEASPHLRGRGQVEWRRRIQADFANVRAALNHLAESGEIETCMRLWFDLFAYWIHSSRHVEAIELGLLAQETATEDIDPRLVVQVWWAIAHLGASITRPSSVDHARQGLALAESLDDPVLVGMMEIALGAAIRHTSVDPEYLEHLEAGRDLLADHAGGEAWWEPDWDRAMVAYMLAEYLPGDHHERREHFDTADRLFSELGDVSNVAANLQWTYFDSRAPRGWTEANLRRALELSDQGNSRLVRGHAAMLLGTLLALDQEHSEAVRLLTTGIADLSDCGDLNCWANSLRFRAASNAMSGDPDRAVRDLRDSIEFLPRLPLTEFQVMRTFDTAAYVLYGTDKTREAATTFGLAHKVESPDPVRRKRMDAIGDMISERLPEGEMERLMAEGAAMSTEEGLERIQEWLDDPT